MFTEGPQEDCAEPPSPPIGQIAGLPDCESAIGWEECWNGDAPSVSSPSLSLEGRCVRLCGVILGIVRAKTTTVNCVCIYLCFLKFYFSLKLG